MEINSERDTGGVNQVKRAVFMLAFWIASRITLMIVVVLALFQLLCTVITKNPNEKITQFGRNLGTYLSQIVDFLTYNTELKPWPFQDWPGVSAEAREGAESE